MKNNRLSLRLKVYAASHIWINRCLNVLTAVHQGVWLGLLSRSSLQELTDRYYIQRSTGPPREDYQSCRFNLSGLRVFEETSYEEYFSKCGAILVGSAGGGRELLAFSDKGHVVDAFECNLELLEACRDLLRAEGLSARVVGAKPGHVPEELGIYDGAVCGWGAYMHVAGRESRVEFLRGFRAHLRSGGPILISFFTRRDSRSNRLSIRIARAIRIVCRGEPVEDGDSISGSFDHCFVEHEIRDELRDGGFELAFYSEEGYGHAVGLAMPAAGEESIG